MQHVELDDQTAQILLAQAAAQGLTISQYLQSVVPLLPKSPANAASLDELDAELKELALDLPSLPADFSRADIYDDHD